MSEPPGRYCQPVHAPVTGRCRRVLSFALYVVLSIALSSQVQAALGEPSSVRFAPVPGAFPLAEKAKLPPLVTDQHDWPGVLRAVRDLQVDIEHVVAHAPPIA